METLGASSQPSLYLGTSILHLFIRNLTKKYISQNQTKLVFAPIILTALVSTSKQGRQFYLWSLLPLLLQTLCESDDQAQVWDPAHTLQPPEDFYQFTLSKPGRGVIRRGSCRGLLKLKLLDVNHLRNRGCWRVLKVSKDLSGERIQMIIEEKNSSLVFPVLEATF